MIYPGGADLGRTVIHAVVLILAAVALAFASRQIAATMDEATAREVERDDMFETMSSAFGLVMHEAVDGDFSNRVKTTFSGPVLHQIAGGIDDLRDAIESGVMTRRPQ